MDGQELELEALAPDAVVLNYLRPHNSTLARRLSDAGTAVIVLDTEGGVFSDIGRYGQLLSPDSELRARVTAWLGWGPTLSAHAVSRGWFRENQVVVTGAPRFDLYLDPWRQAATSLVPADVQRPMILVNGNFPVANPRFQTRAQEAETLVRRYGFALEDVARWQAVQSDAMCQLAKATNRAARSNPELAFVYRPHPFERLDTYDRLLEPLPNLTTRKDGGVDGWILEAAAVVQRGCTTAIEAGLAGVPAMSPRWVPVFEEVGVAEAVSIGCESWEELQEGLATAASGSLKIPDAQRRELDAIVKDWFYAIDGHSHQRVAQAILERAGTGDRESRARKLRASRPTDGLRGSLKRSVPPALWRLRPGRHDPIWAKSEKSFSVADVRRIVQAVSSAADRKPSMVGTSLAHQAGSYRFGRSVTVSR